jgi:hypothetical protein
MVIMVLLLDDVDYRSCCSARWRSWARSRGVILPRPNWFGRESSSEAHIGLRKLGGDDSKIAGRTERILQASKHPAPIKPANDSTNPHTMSVSTKDSRCRRSI